MRLSADAARGKTDLQTLFLNHHFGNSGFALLPQGSPTNNTEEGSSAYSRTDDPDASFDFVFKDKARSRRPTTGSTSATASGSPKRSASTPSG